LFNLIFGPATMLKGVDDADSRFRDA
jgi:hypothetical protein